ncbi:MAG: hypothetical protein Q8K92_07270 [Leadbetterella sp.]|jgi:hypothetical protein|nr:hypothetical protein [Leadbetterella sp.]
MKSIFFSILFLSISLSSSGQNYNKEQTIKYINDKMKIADPVFNNFALGDNGEAVIKWVNRNIYTEYRFNIREIEFKTDVNSNGDNIINLTCNPGLNNCLQLANREMISVVGNVVDFKGFKMLDVASIAGFDNVLSVKNAFVYLKVLSITDNASKTSAKRDPFLN